MHTRFVSVLRESLMDMGFDSKCNFAHPTILLWLLCPWTWGIFFGEIQHSSLDGRSAAICNFGVLSGEVERMSFYSAILEKMLRMEKAIHVWTQGIYGRYPHLPHNLAVNQTALKIMTLKMKQINNNHSHATYFVKAF